MLCFCVGNFVGSSVFVVLLILLPPPEEAHPAPATIPYCDPQADVSAATRIGVRLKYHRRR